MLPNPGGFATTINDGHYLHDAVLDGVKDREREPLRQRAVVVAIRFGMQTAEEREAVDVSVEIGQEESPNPVSRSS